MRAGGPASSAGASRASRWFVIAAAVIAVVAAVLALHDAATLAPLAEVAIAGSQLYPLADGVVTLGDGDGDAWGTLRRYLVTP